MRMLSPLSTEWSWPLRTLAPVMMGDLFEPSYVSATVSTPNFHPSCDVNEADEHFLVSLDLPGVKKEDIKIEVQKNQLVIAGERNRELKADDGEAIRHERRYGKFERTFTLPATINPDKIEAHFENGVLSVAIPKAEAAKGRTIQIQNGPTGFFNKLLKDAH